MNSFSQFVEWLARNPWFVIAAFLVSVTALISGFIFYRKSKKEKSPRYALRSVNIVRDLTSRVESVQMLYHGQQIADLTSTKILFWNAGRDTIQSQDVPETDPIAFTVKEGYSILDAKIIYMNKPPNRFTVAIAGESKILLHFDYVDKDQGVLIQVLHTGLGSGDIIASGSIKGVGTPIRKYVSRYDGVISPPGALPKTKRRALIAWSSIATIVLLSAIMFFSDPRVFDTGQVLGLTVFVAFIWIPTIFSLRRIVPKDFDIFEGKFFEPLRDKTKENED